MANGTDRPQSTLVIVATIGMIAFNWLASIGKVNGVMPYVISNRYPTVITPAGYSFSIWALIYLGLIVFSVYQALPRSLERFRGVRSLYILTCVLNCAWIYFWHHEMVLPCFGIILALAAALLFINIKLKNAESYAVYWAATAPLSLYFGWVTAASVVNFAVALGVLGVNVYGPGTTALGVGLIFLAAGLAVLARVKLTDYLFPLAVAWALTGIGVKQSGQTLIVSAAAGGVVACLIATCSFVMNLNSSISPTTRANE